MSTQILGPEEDEPMKATFYLNEFYGGHERGLCHQITKDNGYVQLTRTEMFVLCAGFLRHIANEVKA